MANVLHEKTSNDINNLKKEEQMKNLKGKHNDIKNYLGSQKITGNLFGGHQSHKDNIVPYEKNNKKVNAADENINPQDVNAAIKNEVKRSGIDEALAGYPPEISAETKTSRMEDIKEELAEEKQKKIFSKE